MYSDLVNVIKMYKDIDIDIKLYKEKINEFNNEIKENQKIIQALKLKIKENDDQLLKIQA